MNNKTLFMEYTSVPFFRSIADIQHMLVQAGAASISQTMRDKRVHGITFVLPTGNQALNFELPARVEPVFQTLLLQRRRSLKGGEREEILKKAENIAWRQLSKWLEAQIAIVGLGMVQAQEVFMPYCLGLDGRTMFEHWQGRLLEAPKGTA